MERIGIYSTYDVGRITGADPTTVHRWIDQGLLRGFRLPGGHRRVTAAALRTFLLAHGMPIPDALRDAAALRLFFIDNDGPRLLVLTQAVKKLRAAWEVQGASDAVAGLLRIAEFKPTAVVLDLSITGLDCLSLIKSLKKVESSIRVIGMSGGTRTELDKNARGAGATVLLQKPVGAAKIVAAVEGACGILASSTPSDV